jgi:hypothetical protein
MMYRKVFACLVDHQPEVNLEEHGRKWRWYVRATKGKAHAQFGKRLSTFKYQAERVLFLLPFTASYRPHRVISEYSLRLTGGLAWRIASNLRAQSLLSNARFDHPRNISSAIQRQNLTSGKDLLCGRYKDGTPRNGPSKMSTRCVLWPLL